MGNDYSIVVDVAQLVRALVCGTRGRGFESHLPPQHFKLGCSQAVRHQTLTLAFRRFESSHPSQQKISISLYLKKEIDIFLLHRKNRQIFPEQQG